MAVVRRILARLGTSGAVLAVGAVNVWLLLAILSPESLPSFGEVGEVFWSHDLDEDIGFSHWAGSIQPRSLLESHDESPNAEAFSTSHGIASASGGVSGSASGGASGGPSQSHSGSSASGHCPGGGSGSGALCPDLLATCSTGVPPGVVSGLASDLSHEGDEHAPRHLAEHGAGHGDEGRAFAVALLSILFVVFNMIIIMLTGWRNPGIRIVTWKMLSTALCIYCAVLITDAVDKFFIYQVLKGNFKPFPGFGVECPKNWQILFLKGFQFFLMWVVLNSICHYFRGSKSRKRLACAANLGGHLVAFAGINFMCEVANRYEDTVNKALMITAGVAAALWFGMVVLFKMRTCFLEWYLDKARGGESSHSGEEEHKLAGHGHDHDDEHRWLHEVNEGEQDAAALIVGFNIVNILTAIVRGEHVGFCGHHGCVAGQVCNSQEVHLMVVISVMSLGLVGAYMTFRMLCCPELAHMHEPINPILVLSMLMAWAFETSAEWIVIYLQPCMELFTSRMVSAALCTVFAFACVFLFHFFFDRFDLDIQKDIEEKAVVTPRSTTFDRRRQKQEHEDSFAAFNDTVLGFACLVGLGWERSLQPLFAILTGEGGKRVLGYHAEQHQVAVSFIATAVLLAFVLPGWVRHVLPMARAPYEEHEEAVRRQMHASVMRRLEVYRKDSEQQQQRLVNEGSLSGESSEEE